MSKKIGIFEWPVPNGVRMRMPNNTKDIEEDNYLTINAVDNKLKDIERDA